MPVIIDNDGAEFWAARANQLATARAGIARGNLNAFKRCPHKYGLAAHGGAI